MVEFKEVSKAYKKGKNVLNKLSLKLEKNEFIALVGNNGCGKTTTIHILCNILKYDSGEVYAFGKKIEKKYVEYKNKLGVILSEPYYIEEFTVLDYLKFVGKFQHVPKNEIEQRIDDITEFFNIEDYKKKKIKDYSSGNQMKISLSAALIHNPELLILDEPFVNLDIQTTENIINLLKSFKTKKTLFISSHNLDLVADLCDRFLIMDKGKIVADKNKSNYASISELKTSVKEMLTTGKGIQDISWLNS
jgi:ABC-2 type transport system ATP-binding protein